MAKPKRKSPTPPPPPALRIGKLDTVGGIVRELGRLYREARRGQIDIADSTRLAFILKTIREALEASEIERRIAILEAETRHGQPGD